MKTATSFTPTRPTRAALITWSAPTIFSISCRKAATRTRIQRWIGCGGTTSMTQTLERLGELLATKSEPLIIERTFNAPVAKVWNAITDVDQMQQWYFDLKGFRAEVGF